MLLSNIFYALTVKSKSFVYTNIHICVYARACVCDLTVARASSCIQLYSIGTIPYDSNLSESAQDRTDRSRMVWQPVTDRDFSKFTQSKCPNETATMWSRSIAIYRLVEKVRRVIVFVRIITAYISPEEDLSVLCLSLFLVAFRLIPWPWMRQATTFYWPGE